MQGWKTFAAASLLALAACGGGGGGAGSGGGPTAAGLSVDKTSLAFAVDEGADEPAPQVVSGSVTGVKESVLVVIAYTTEGLAAASFELTGATSGSLTVTPKSWTALPAGTYRDTITVSACFDPACARQAPGSPRRVDVTTTVAAAVAPATLELSQRGVALASVPGADRLTQQVTVSDSTGAPTAWTASTSDPWLRVNTGGLSGGTLDVTADPAGLADGFHLGRVTLRSASASIADAVTLPVGLYKRAAAGAATLASPLTEGGGPQRRTFAADGVRPYAYSALGAEIAVHHFHTGERLALLARAGANFSDIVAADDGKGVWALDSARGEIVSLDPQTLTLAPGVAIGATLPPGFQWFYSRMAFARASGRAVLVFSQGGPGSAAAFTEAMVADPASGARLGRVAGWGGNPQSVLAATRGKVLFSLDRGVTGGVHAVRLELQANGRSAVYGRALLGPLLFLSSSLQAFAADPDGGSALFTQYGAGVTQLLVYDGSTIATSVHPDTPWPGFGTTFASAAFLADRRSLVHDGSDELRLYAADRRRLRTWNALPSSWRSGDPGELRLSPDGLRALRGDAFVDLGP